jgi:dolichol-phosphate mannosyltransferase
LNTTIVIPTYNEADNLPRMVAALFSLGIPDLDLLIVDDNSPDGTGQIADELAGQHSGKIDVIHRAGKSGLGTAYIEGFRRCLQKGSQRIVQMDADFSHNPETVLDLISGLDEFDMVLGSRYIEGGKLDKDWAFWRKGLSSFGNLYARAILRVPVRDVTGGFRAWKRETLSELPLQRVKSQGYAFQIEMAYLTYLLGFEIKEIPIYFAERESGVSKMSRAIQIEAARRVWEILRQYRDLRK